MTRVDLPLTGVEVFFEPGDIIVSKTDQTGRLTYCNRTFMKIAGYQEPELLGAPHSILRHPDTPRCVFKLLWDTISAGQELFAYVVNRTKSGDHYWVLAHVTPSWEAGRITGYHSSRRAPDRAALGKIQPLYRELLAEETRHTDRKAGLKASHERFLALLRQNKVTYDEFVFSL